MRVREAGWDALLIVLSSAILLYVWRLHDIFSALRAVPLFVLVSVLCVALFVLNNDRHRKRGAALRGVFLLVLILQLVMLASAATSIYPGLSVRFMLQDHLRIVVLAMMVAVSIRSVADVRRLAAVHLLGAVATAIAVLTLFQFGDDGRVVAGYYYDANDIALLLVCALPLSLPFLTQGRSLLLRIAVAGGAMLILAAIVGTGSRGGFLGLISTALFVLIRYRTVRTSRRLLGLLAAVLVFAVVANEQFWHRMQTILHADEDYNWAGQAESGRTEVWKRGVGYMLDRPVLGVGPSAFGVAEGTLSDQAALQAYGIGFKWSAAHNSFLQIGAELGVPALILFIMIIARLFRECGRVARSSVVAGHTRALAEAMMASIVGYCVAGFFLSHGYSKFLYIVAAMVAGLETSVAKPSEHREHARQRTLTPRGGNWDLAKS